MLHVRSIIACGVLVFSSPGLHALETTSNDGYRNVNAGFEQRLETTNTALVAAFNDLKGKIDDILARLGLLETDVALIKNNGANNEVQRWNPKLEARIDTIEATDVAQTNAINNHGGRIATLEGRGASELKVTYSGVYDAAKKQAVSMGKWTYCGLSGFSASEENHSCRVTRSGTNWTLNGNAFNEGGTTCYAICMRIE